MITIRAIDEDFIIDFDSLESWDDFEKIVEILKKSFEVRIIQRIDGPESRLWDIELDGLPYSLHNNPYGNYLKAKTQKSIDYLKETLGHIQVHFL